MTTTLRLGKLASDHSKPALLLGPHLRTVAHPDQRDWLGKVSDWPMYLPAPQHGPTTAGAADVS